MVQPVVSNFADPLAASMVRCPTVSVGGLRFAEPDGRSLAENQANGLYLQQNAGSKENSGRRLTPWSFNS
jgi:hypothetical protein